MNATEQTMKLHDLSAKLDLVLRQQQEILDRQAIHDCVLAYSRGMDRMDTELVLSAYHSDAVDDHGSIVAYPRELVDWANNSHAQQSLTHHLITNHWCELQGDVAHSESYFFAVLKSPTSEEVTLTGGRYIDRFERREGHWKIAARKCVVEWGGTPEMEPLAEASRRLHNQGGLPARDKSDPSYERPLTIYPERFNCVRSRSDPDRGQVREGER
jgi:hypothetical protein